MKNNSIKNIYSQLNGLERARFLAKDLVQKHISGEGFLSDTDLQMLAARNPSDQEAKRKVFGMLLGTPDLWNLFQSEYSDFRQAMDELRAARLMLNLVPPVAELKELFSKLATESAAKDQVTALFKTMGFEFAGEKLHPDEETMSFFLTGVIKANAAVERIRALESVLKEIESATGIHPFFSKRVLSGFQESLRHVEFAIIEFNHFIDWLMKHLSLDDSFRINAEAVDESALEYLHHQFLVKPSTRC